MSVTPAAPVRDRRAERQAAARQEIVDAAWELVREHGLGALSMRDLGARVGMRAQSIYAYFPSKHAIFDAMFAEGNRIIYERVAEIPESADPVETLRRHVKVFLQFCVEDPVRFQLLYQRPIPGFEPSPESYQVAVEGLELARAALRACGIRSVRAFDVWTALVSGLAAQQTSNEPGGTRWTRLADEVMDMFLARYREPDGRRK
jgi:AcrR family transcriptional regulator